MKSYLCAAGHHFHSTDPRCPLPDCTAEVRPTAVHPLHGRSPAFDRLKPLPTPHPVSPIHQAGYPEVKHSIRWWAYIDGTRVRRKTDKDSTAWDATCACGWDSAAGRSPSILGEPMTTIDRLVRDHKR